MIGCGTVRAVLLAAAAVVLAGRLRPRPVSTREMEDATRAALARAAADELMRHVDAADEDALYRRIFGQDPPQR